jgi:hypothetical protein
MSRLSRGKPSRALQTLTEGKVGKAVGVAAKYADAAISEVTKEAYLRHWGILRTGAKRMMSPSLTCRSTPCWWRPISLRSPKPMVTARCVAAIVYHHRRRNVPFNGGAVFPSDPLSGAARFPNYVNNASLITANVLREFASNQETRSSSAGIARHATINGALKPSKFVFCKTRALQSCLKNWPGSRAELPQNKGGTNLAFIIGRLRVAR